jgi:chromosome segregation ATPase
MGQESELQRLERFVAKLLTNYSELRTEKAVLVQQLDERNRQIEALRSQLATEEAERGEIGQRVGKLVEQIEEWEKSLDQTAEAVEPPAPVEDLSGEESELEEYEVQEEIEELAEQAGEEEVRVQHNLFSLSGGQR